METDLMMFLLFAMFHMSSSPLFVPPSGQVANFLIL